MSPQDKIKYVVQLIDYARHIAPEGHVCWIEQDSLDRSVVTPLETHSILSKLQLDDGIIELIDSPFSNSVRPWTFENIKTEAFAIKVLPAFMNNEMVKT